MFKNSFTVNSKSLPLREAFAKEAEALGWINQENNVNPLYGNSLYFNGKIIGADLKEGHFWNAKGDNVYYLPEQWNEAIKAASEKEEPKVLLTDEDEVYYEGAKEIVNLNDEYFKIKIGDDFIVSSTFREDLQLSEGEFKRFASLKAAEDYLVLQKAIKDSSLKIGDNSKDNEKVKFEGKEYYAMVWNNSPFKGFSDSSGMHIIVDFKIFLKRPCAILKFEAADSKYALPLEQFIKKDIEIGTFKLEIGENTDGQKTASFGCQSFSLEELNVVTKLLNYPIEADIIIKGTKITKELIDKIAENL